MWLWGFVHSAPWHWGWALMPGEEAWGSVSITLHGVKVSPNPSLANNRPCVLDPYIPAKWKWNSIVYKKHSIQLWDNSLKNACIRVWCPGFTQNFGYFVYLCNCIYYFSESTFFLVPEEKYLTLEGFQKFAVDRAKQDIRSVWRAILACGYDLHFERLV